MIEMKNVNKWYGKTFQVLKDCSLNVAKGEVIVVGGPSGSGKSTLIKTVNGLEPINDGEITVAAPRSPRNQPISTRCAPGSAWSFRILSCIPI